MINLKTLLSVHARTSNILHLDQKAAKCTTVMNLWYILALYSQVYWPENGSCNYNFKTRFWAANYN